jgi:molybdopterin-guanine dinucleotide biosynthesis protein A
MSDVDVSALILAGGRATRMGGVAKHELVIAGETIFARQTRVLAPLVDEIIVATPVDLAGYRCVRDAEQGIGPLAGIAAGLASARTRWLLVVAGDMPDLSSALVAHMLECARDPARAAHEAVGLRIGGLPEPLFCVVRVDAARVVIGELFAVGIYKASALLDQLDVAWVDEDAIRAFDPELRSLRNVNAPGDL